MDINEKWVLGGNSLTIEFQFIMGVERESGLVVGNIIKIIVKGVIAMCSGALDVSTEPPQAPRHHYR